MTRRTRYICGYFILAALTFLLLVLNLGVGSVVTPGQVLELLKQPDNMATVARIVWRIRFPRTLAAALLGGALSLSGFLLQTFFANPVAGPFVLGISSGAKLVVALTMIAALGYDFVLNSAALIAAAFAGSLLSMGFILLISGKVRRMPLLVLCGVMIGYICSAITDFAVTFADDSNIVNLHNWSLGSFSGTSWANVRAMAAVVLAGLLCAILLSKPMGAYQLGEVYAANMGVNMRRFRAELVLLSILKDLVSLEGLAVVMSLHELELARKVSDIIVCVKDGTVDRVGPPKEIFSSGYIARLYDVTSDLLEKTRGILPEELYGL